MNKLEIRHRGTNKIIKTIEYSRTQNINLAGEDLSNTDLSNIDFTGAWLKGTNFTGANLQGTNFSYSFLEGTIFENSIIRLSNFSNAYINRCSFKGTIAGNNVNFGGAYIQDTTFECSNLIGVNFSGATLNNVKLLETKLRYCVGDGKVIVSTKSKRGTIVITKSLVFVDSSIFTKEQLLDINYFKKGDFNHSIKDIYKHQKWVIDVIKLLWDGWFSKRSGS